MTLAGHSTLRFWVDFKAQVANLSFVVSQKNSNPMPAARAVNPSRIRKQQPANHWRDDTSQKLPGAASLGVGSWQVLRTHCSQNHPQELGMAPGCAELGLCPCRHVSTALSPQPGPPCMCFGQLMVSPYMAGQWQEQSHWEQLILPCMTKHGLFPCPSAADPASHAGSR